MLQIFNFNQHQVRAMLDGAQDPWFVGKDIADILGYSDTQAMTRRLDCEDFITDKLSGMNMKSTLINESGLYTAVLNSSKPEAKPFKRWVTKEVLPSIRKHGGYLTPERTEELINNPDLLIQLATTLKEERAEKLRLAEVAEIQGQQIKSLAPKANYYDQVLASVSTYVTDQIAKEMGMTAMRLNKVLKDKGVQFKRNDQWVLNHRYISKGYTDTRTAYFTHTDGSQGTRMSTVWTEAGREFIHQLMIQ